MTQVTSTKIEKFREFSSSESAAIALQALTALLSFPDVFKRDSEFDTMYHVAMLDGEKAILERFKNLINASLGGDIEELKILDGERK